MGLPPVPETPNVIEDEITSDNIIAVLHRVNETMGPIQVYNFKLYQYNENGWEQNQTNQTNQTQTKYRPIVSYACQARTPLLHENTIPKR